MTIPNIESLDPSTLRPPVLEIGPIQSPKRGGETREASGLMFDDVGEDGNFCKLSIVIC